MDGWMDGGKGDGWTVEIKEERRGGQKGGRRQGGREGGWERGG